MASEQQFGFEQSQMMAQEPKKHSFGHKLEISPEMVQLSNETKDIGRRIRTLEERYSNMQTKAQINEQNMISRHKQVSAEFKTMNAELNDVKKEVMEMKDKILIIIKEIQSYAKKEEVKVLERYIHFWEPLNFVSRTELKEILDEAMNRGEK